MEEDENVSECRLKNVWNKSRWSLKAITTNAFGIGSILQGVASKTMALVAIASNTISMAIASGQFSGNDLDGNVATDIDSDYVFDSIDKRIYRNLSINTPVLRPSVIVNGSSSDSDNGENVTMASLGNNLFVAAVTSTYNAIKSNDTVMMPSNNFSSITLDIDVESTPSPMIESQNNYWALTALILVVGTAAGNILVCLAITWERRLQNVTNYFLMSLAMTDLMVAILVMPLGILTLVKGEYKHKLSSFLGFFSNQEFKRSMKDWVKIQNGFELHESFHFEANTIEMGIFRFFLKDELSLIMYATSKFMVFT